MITWTTAGWAERADADFRTSDLESRPHLTLECGHLCPPGNGPIAESGFGYCPAHGVTRINPAP